MRKRVLCVVGWWPTDGNYTGIFIKEHVRAIQLLHDVEVIYMEVRKGPISWAPIRIVTSQEDGITVHRVTVTTPVRRFNMMALLARRAYSNFVKRYARSHFQLIHIHVRTEVTEQVKSVARMLDVPMVITEHNSFYHLGINQLPVRTADRMKRSIRKWFADERIVSVMPVSHDLERVLHEDYGIPDRKLTVVPNVASEEFVPGAPPTAGTFKIMLAAVWRPPKDHDVFIRAIKAIPPHLLEGVEIEWAGYGPAYAEIQDRCQRELPHARIAFPGALPKPLLARSMQRSNLFVLPTLADNLPCVVLESHCCGTPVISMNVNGVPELIDGSNGVLVAAGDAEALANALVEQIEHPDRSDRAAIAARALAKYSRPVVAGMIDSVYRSAIAEHPNSR